MIHHNYEPADRGDDTDNTSESEESFVDLHNVNISLHRPQKFDINLLFTTQTVEGLLQAFVSCRSKGYGPCPYCYGYYVKKDLWRHNCTSKPKDASGNAKFERIAENSNFLVPVPAASEQFLKLKEVLHTLRPDETSIVAKNDPCILQLTLREYRRIGDDRDRQAYICTNMREVARLLIQLRKDAKLPNAKLESFIVPQQCKVLLNAVRKLCGFHNDEHTHATPALALKLGHAVKYCATLLAGSAIEKRRHGISPAERNVLQIVQAELGNTLNHNTHL